MADLKQRLVLIDVEEVSLVDDPANETPFHVIKRKEMLMSGQTAKDENKDAEGTETETPVEGTETVTETQTQKDEEGAEPEGTDEEPSEDPPKEPEGDDVTSEDEEPEETETQTQKDKEPEPKEPEEPTVQQPTVKRQKNAEGKEEVVLDIETFKGMVASLNAVVEDSEKEAAEREASPEVATAKAIGEAIAESLKPVQEALEGVSKRLQKVEETRGTSNAEGSEVETQKNKDSDDLWKGVVRPRFRQA